MCDNFERYNPNESDPLNRLNSTSNLVYQYNTPFAEDCKICLSIIPPAGMIYVQRECKDFVIGFLHTYGLAWTEDTNKLNNPDGGPRHPAL